MNTIDKTYIEEKSLHDLNCSEDFSLLFSTLPTSHEIYLPIIDSKWERWSQLNLQSKERTVFAPIFQDEIDKFKNIIINNSNIHFQIILYKRIDLNELNDLKSISYLTNINFTLLINKSWPFEEILKSLPFFIRKKLNLNFDDSINKFQLNIMEREEFYKRAKLYLDNNNLELTTLYNKENADKKFNTAKSRLKRLPLTSDIQSQLKGLTKSLAHMSDTNPLSFIITVFFSINNLFFRFLYPSLHFLFYVIPLRILIKLYYFFFVALPMRIKIKTYYFFVVALPMRIKGRILYFYGICSFLKGNSIHYWWKFSPPIRKIYYIAKFHFDHRDELPIKVIEFLKGKRKLW